MASYYELSKSVRITNADPIDGDRYIADTLSDRDKLVTPIEGVVRAHDGLQVYVKADKKLYLLVDINAAPKALWKEIFLGSGGDKHKEHVQSIASDVWLVEHNLNKIPSVTVIDANKSEVECEVEHTDADNLVLRFSIPISGKAYLN